MQTLIINCRTAHLHGLYPTDEGQALTLNASLDQPAPAIATEPRFWSQDQDGIGVVRDAKTGLSWFATNLGGKRMTHAEAVAAVEALGGDWRLPDVDELQTIVDRSRHDPALHSPHLYHDPKSEMYWTASPVASAPDYAWYVAFASGSVYGSYRDATAWVRPVRGPRVPGQ